MKIERQCGSMRSRHLDILPGAINALRRAEDSRAEVWLTGNIWVQLGIGLQFAPDN